jgi:hypothetical protein
MHHWRLDLIGQPLTIGAAHHGGGTGQIVKAQRRLTVVAEVVLG